jgi:tetratricopeptide (TPR) repeat protein
MKPQPRPALLALVALLAWQTAARADELDRRKLYTKTLKGCAAVLTSGGPASGWVVDAGKRWLITCQHVIGTREEVEIVFPAYKNGKLVHDRAWYVQSAPRIKGKIISADSKRDLALVELESLPDGVTALALAADSGQPADSLHMIGNPAASGAMWNYSAGTLRAVYRKRFTYKGLDHEVDALIGETQLPGNPGDSGAAVFGDQGEVLGVHSGGTPEGVQLMSTYIDVAEVRAFLAEPLKGVVKARSFDDFFRRATEQFARGDLDAALADYNEALKINPNHSEAHRCRAGVYIRKRQYDKALEDANEAIRLDSKNANAYNERAVCLGAKADYKAALADYNEAIKNNPKDGMFFGGRAWAYNNLQQWDKAVEDATEAIRLKPGLAFCHHERGLGYFGLKKYDKAAADFKEAVRLDPNDQSALLYRGMTSAVLGQTKEGLADVSEVLRKNPKHSQALRERGAIYFLIGEHQKALADYDRCLELTPNDANAYLGRGYVHKALGNTQQAEADFRRAVELNPSLARPQ